VTQQDILDLGKKRFRSKKNTFQVMLQSETAHVAGSGETLRVK
jgi:hypothetical protein